MRTAADKTSGKITRELITVVASFALVWAFAPFAFASDASTDVTTAHATTSTETQGDAATTPASPEDTAVTVEPTTGAAITEPTVVASDPATQAEPESSGLAPQGTTAITLFIYPNGKPTADGNSGTGTGWSYDKTQDVLQLDGDHEFTFTGDPCNCSRLYNYSTIISGTFDCADISNEEGGRIVDGTFNGTVHNESDCLILGGTFLSYVYNFGTISGGGFSGEVDNAQIGVISGGDFQGEVTNYGTITTGEGSPTFTGPVTNMRVTDTPEVIEGTIDGGTFYGIITNQDAVITPGPGLYWGLENILSNVTTDNPTTRVESDATYTETLTAAEGYSLPETITVTFDGVTATAGSDYTWNPTTGAVTIPAIGDVDRMGPITITASGVALPAPSHKGTLPKTGDTTLPWGLIGSLILGMGVLLIWSLRSNRQGSRLTR